MCVFHEFDVLRKWEGVDNNSITFREGACSAIDRSSVIGRTLLTACLLVQVTVGAGVGGLPMFWVVGFYR